MFFCCVNNIEKQSNKDKKVYILFLYCIGEMSITFLNAKPKYLGEEKPSSLDIDSIERVVNESSSLALFTLKII